MKAYGCDRYERGTCNYGCCYASSVGNPHLCSRKANDRRSRSRARQAAKKLASEEAAD